MAKLRNRHEEPVFAERPRRLHPHKHNIDGRLVRKS